MYIKDLETGRVHKYGSDRHDSLRISPDGKYIVYENLQNGDGSRGGYRFCDEKGVIPEDDPVLRAYGADAYFNIGGFDDAEKAERDKKYTQEMEALKKLLAEKRGIEDDGK